MENIFLFFYSLVSHLMFFILDRGLLGTLRISTCVTTIINAASAYCTVCCNDHNKQARFQPLAALPLVGCPAAGQAVQRSGRVEASSQHRTKFILRRRPLENVSMTAVNSLQRSPTGLRSCRTRKWLLAVALAVPQVRILSPNSSISHSYRR